MTTPSMRDAALQYAACGLQVFPIRPNSKIPLTAHGVKDATCNRVQVEDFWRRWPNANIGLACGRASGLVVLDFDRKNGKRGLETYMDLPFPALANTLIASTPSAGLHVFFQYRAGLKNVVDILPGLDIRTDGGYVLLWPSDIDGKGYEWLQEVQALPMPKDLAALLRRPEAQPAIPRPRTLPSSRLATIDRARKYIAAVPGAVEGQSGDITTFKLACRLVRGFALSDAETFDLMSSWNRGCRPPWSERDLLKKIRSARLYGAEVVGGKLEASAQ